MLLHNGRVVLPDRIMERGAVLLDRGLIKGVGQLDQVADLIDPGLPASLQEIDCRGKLICPGFVDLHIHGGAGADVMDGTPQALETIARHCASQGTTGFLATTLTAPAEDLERILSVVHQWVRSLPGESGARLLGVHLEGPFLSAAFKGAQNGRWLRDPDLAELQRYLESFPGIIKLVTIAPELPGAFAAISFLRGRGVAVSAGHSAATYRQVEEALRLGLSHITHTFNGMSGFHHRQPGVAAAALALDRLNTEIIADGVHVDPDIVAFLIRVKGPERVLLVTDSISATGLPDGRYQLGGLEIRVQGKEARLAAGNLAGSTLTMNVALRHVLKWTGLSLPEAVGLASRNPARVLGLEGRKGSLEPGKDADVTVLDDDFQVALTVVGGRLLFSAESPSRG